MRPFRRVLATSRPYSIFKVKKIPLPRRLRVFQLEERVRAPLPPPEVSKGESGLIKMGAVSTLGARQVSGRPFIEALFVITPN